MKLVIDIPEEMYTNGQLDKFFGCSSKKLDEVIYTGTSLPEGHGRLVDADRLEQVQNERLQYGEIRIWELKLITSALDSAETVVEADGGAE